MTFPQYAVMSEAVPISAPLTRDYPQFFRTANPNDGLTIEAWKGVIQPFADDATARSVLADVEANRQLYISAGSIRNSSALADHWANPLLVGMDIACEVLICIQPHAFPRAYLLSPRFARHYDSPQIHPHPRGDQTVEYEKAQIPGLCVVSGSEFQFDSEQNFHTQFLDQVTQYVAKHLIWLKTRRLYRFSGTGKSILYTPRPGEVIFDHPPKQHVICLPTGPIGVVDFWSGYWPGKSARATTPLEHIRQIRKVQRCWCGVDQPYGDCHFASDWAQLSQFQQAKYACRLVA